MLSGFWRCIFEGTWANGDAGPRHLFDVIGQCFAIAQEMNCGVWKAAADLVIDPDVNGFKYDDFERSAELIRAGETATRTALPEIRKWLQQSEARPKTAATPHHPTGSRHRQSNFTRINVGSHHCPRRGGCPPGRAKLGSSTKAPNSLESYAVFRSHPHLSS